MGWSQRTTFKSIHLIQKVWWRQWWVLQISRFIVAACIFFFNLVIHAQCSISSYFRYMRFVACDARERENDQSKLALKRTHKLNAQNTLSVLNHNALTWLVTRKRALSLSLFSGHIQTAQKTRLTDCFGRV